MPLMDVKAKVLVEVAVLQGQNTRHVVLTAGGLAVELADQGGGRKKAAGAATQSCC